MQRRRHALFLAFMLLVLTASATHAGTLTVMWDQNPESHVAGYIVYVGTQSGVHGQSFDVGNTTSFIFRDAVPGQQYYFAVAAYAPGPLIGPKSTEVSGYSNAPPSLTNPGNQTSQVGHAVALQLVGSDPYGEPLTYAAIGLPPGLTLTASTGRIQGTGTTAGTYQVSASVSDGVLSDSQVFTWTMTASLDTQAPAVTVTAPSAASSFTSALATLTLAGTATDNVGVTAVTWANDRGGSGTASGTSSWTASGIPLKVGVNVITVRAQDAAGNSGAAVVSVTYVDSEAPALSITSPTSGSTFTTASTSVALAGTASDNVGVSAVTWTNDRGGSGTASGTSSWTISNVQLQTGTNVLTVTARDAAGNSTSRMLTVTRSDSEAPKVAITSPTSGSTFIAASASIGLAGTASDNVGVTAVTWTNDRGGSGTASGTAAWTISTVPLQIGPNVITVTARDAAGNTGSRVLTVSLADQQPPVVTLTRPTSEATFSTTDASVTLAGTAIDNVGVTSVTWTADSGASGVASGTATWSTGPIALREGDTRIVVSAHDAAGNQASTTLTVSMLAPLAKPTIAITSPEVDGYSSTTETISLMGVAGGAADIAEVVWTNDRGGSGVATGRNNWLVPEVALSRGTNVIQVAARSADGAVATDEVVVVYEPDTNAPRVSISSPTKGAKHNTPAESVVLAGVAVDDVGVVSVTWTSSSGLSGTASGTSVWSAEVLLEEGDNVVTVTASDAAGNTGQAVLTVSRKPNSGRR